MKIRIERLKDYVETTLFGRKRKPALVAAIMAENSSDVRLSDLVAAKTAGSLVV